MQEPAISVAMSVYNNDVYLGEAIESILAQSFGDFEFLILNDGSTDGSRAIIDDYAARDHRIRPIHRENRGLIVSLNELIEKSRAPLIARMDGDDVALPERFIRQKAFLDAHPDHGMVGSWVTLIGEKGEPLGDGGEKPVSAEEIVANLAAGPLFSHPTVIFRTDLVRSAGGYRAAFRHCEDHELWLRLAGRTRMANLPERLLRYRVYPGQVSKRHFFEQIVNAYAARFIHEACRDGRPDPSGEWSAVPPLDRIDAVLGTTGVGAQIRAAVVDRLDFDPGVLAGEGYGLLRDHLRDENVDAGLILRIVRRMAVAGHPLRAVRVALALLGSKAR